MMTTGSESQAQEILHSIGDYITYWGVRFLLHHLPLSISIHANNRRSHAACIPVRRRLLRDWRVVRYLVSSRKLQRQPGYKTIKALLKDNSREHTRSSKKVCFAISITFFRRDRIWAIARSTHATRNLARNRNKRAS